MNSTGEPQHRNVWAKVYLRNGEVAPTEDVFDSESVGVVCERIGNKKKIKRITLSGFEYRVRGNLPYEVFTVIRAVWVKERGCDLIKLVGVVEKNTQ